MDNEVKISKQFKNIFPCLRYFYGIAWKRDKSYFLSTILEIIVKGFTPFINIFIPKLIIDQLLGERDVNILALLISVLVLLNLAAAGANNLFTFLNDKYRVKFDNLFYEMLGEKCMRMDFAHTENAEILARRQKAERGGTDNTYGTLYVMTGVITALISAVITFAGTLYVVGRLSPLLLAILVAITIINMVVVSNLSKGSVQFYKDLIELNRKFGYYNWNLKDFKYGKDIRTYNAVPMITEHSDYYVNTEWYMQRKFNRKQNRFTTATTFLNSAQQALLYGYLGIQVVRRAITVGEFQMLITAAVSFATSLRNIVENFIALARTVEFMNEYRLFMQIEDTARSGTKKAEKIKHTIEFRNVSFKYPGAENYSLRKVSIKIEAGSKLSVVGQNGAGKTTFIKLLCRLYDPTEGEILIDGINVLEYDIDSYRELLSVVFQDYKLFAFTLRENIVGEKVVNKGDIISALDKAGFSERYEKLEAGLNTSVYKSFDKNGIEFSGGESQKIALARAIYKNAPVTVLDEPPPRLTLWRNTIFTIVLTNLSAIKRRFIFRTGSQAVNFAII
ncbi:MAG: ABC transporter ATP-binding protein/permease [Oscillospiraceae bacterium]|jgi:ATP-binding cassette subfamily B protein/ATP-binding cassette subfamily C protein|nr:ABC transporter ATP-binding protein/permease [Oscillospiraceae bacterium]